MPLPAIACSTEHDYSELLLLSSDAQHAKEVALAELERVKTAARQEKETRTKALREKQVRALWVCTRRMPCTPVTPCTVSLSSCCCDRGWVSPQFPMYRALPRPALLKTPCLGRSKSKGRMHCRSVSMDSLVAHLSLDVYWARTFPPLLSFQSFVTLLGETEHPLPSSCRC
jgi:hypothetical protein